MKRTKFFLLTLALTFVFAAAFYYIFNAVVAWGMERFERKLSYYR